METATLSAHEIEHKMAMEAVGIAHMMLAQYKDRYEMVLRSERYMHDVGGLLDPTLYKQMLWSKSFAQQKRLIEAALAFIRATGEVKAEFVDGEKTSA